MIIHSRQPESFLLLLLMSSVVLPNPPISTNPPVSPVPPVTHTLLNARTRRRFRVLLRRASPNPSLPTPLPPRAVRIVPISVISVSRQPSSGAKTICEEYDVKISRYAPFSWQQIRPNPNNVKDPYLQRDQEAERVLKTIKSTDFVVALDERGKRATSTGMADVVARAGDEGYQRLVVRGKGKGKETGCQSPAGNRMVMRMVLRVEVGSCVVRSM